MSTIAITITINCFHIYCTVCDCYDNFCDTDTHVLCLQLPATPIRRYWEEISYKNLGSRMIHVYNCYKCHEDFILRHKNNLQNLSNNSGLPMEHIVAIHIFILCPFYNKIMV